METEIKPKDISAPQHAFEVSIKIGANESSYIARALQEISETLDREITPDCYREELEKWRSGSETR